jgi:hypothetical protein
MQVNMQMYKWKYNILNEELKIYEENIIVVALSDA